MECPRKSEGRREIPVDIIPEILVRLPTKDFVRSSSVCKLWRSIVADPSFRKLHVAHHVAASSQSSEVLLVTETREPGRSDEASVFNLSSAKALCQVAIPSGYSLAGVCNGFLCFSFDHDQAPPVVCNPVTGETLHLPKAPPTPAVLSHLFILGSFPASIYSSSETNHVAAYTLGGGGGWRQCSYASRFHPVRSPAPVHIDGKLFVTTAHLATIGGRAARMLVIDVATETRRSYRIPYNYDDYNEAWDNMIAVGFDLNGQMCLAVNVGFYPLQPRPRLKTQFWVMRPPADELEDKGDGDGELYWDLRYSFDFDDALCFLFRPRGAWIDHAQMLCYCVGQCVYKYDTRGYSSPSSDVEIRLFDQRLELPAVPCQSHDVQVYRWTICGGYSCSLLSPLVFALPPFQDGKGKKRPRFEHAMLRALKVEPDEHMDDSTV